MISSLENNFILIGNFIIRKYCRRTLKGIIRISQIFNKKLFNLNKKAKQETYLNPENKEIKNNKKKKIKRNLKDSKMKNNKIIKENINSF